MWESDAVTNKGRHYSIDAPVTMNPKPMSRPLLMWIAGGAERAIRRAAKMGDGWVIAPGSTSDVAKEGIEIYREAVEGFGRDINDMSIVLRRDAHISLLQQSAIVKPRLYSRMATADSVPWNWKNHWPSVAPQSASRT